MTAIDPDTLDAEARRTRRFTRINKADKWFQVLGLAWLTPILKAVELREAAVREKEKEVAFYERQDARNAEHIANGDTDKVRDRAYTGKPTYYDQIWTSIKTVFFGFLIASIIAIPLGIAAGLSVTANAALNPLIHDLHRVAPVFGCGLDGADRG